MFYMLLGCSFKTGPTIHSRALSIAASGMIITLSTNGCSHSTKIDYSRSSGCGDFKDAVQEDPPYLLFGQEKEALLAG